MKKRNNKSINIDDRYEIKNYQICPFEKLTIGETRFYHPLRNEGYEYVLCVEDKKHNQVIEIVNGHTYKCIEMISSYMLNKQKIIDHKRYAICPIYVSLIELSESEIERINLIINQLNNNETFINGNYVMTNNEYKESIHNYNSLKNEKIERRIKRKKKWMH